MAIDKYGNRYKPSRKKFNGFQRFHSVDKTLCHHSVYLTQVYALDLKCDFIDSKAVLSDWTLVTSNKSYRGKNLFELKNKLYDLIKLHDLKTYSNKCFYKDQVLVYVNNTAKAKGILQDLFTITNEFSDDKTIHQFTIMNYFVISTCEGWTESMFALNIYNDMQKIMNEYFIPNEKVFITPYQYNRKRLRKMNTTPSILPDSYSEYQIWKSCYYGGAAFSDRNIDYNIPIIEYDRKSAYLYEYFIPHMSGPLKEIDTNNWKKWLDNMKVTNSLGVYKITFEMTHGMLNVFKTGKKPFEYNKEYTIDITLLNIDLKLFFKCADVKSIECLTLYEYETNMLPKPVIDHIVNCYLDKETYKDNLHKVIANANYGSLCINLTNQKLNELRDKPYYCPMWGYEIVAYARQHLYDCGCKLDGWIYSDTDSIFCRKTPENEVIINEYNNYMQKVIKRACEPDYYNLDFELVKKIGLFKFEVEIKKMCIRGIRTYAYIDIDNNFVQKASGMCSDAKNTYENWVSDDELDYGHKVTKIVNKDGYFEKTKKIYEDVNLNTSSEEILGNLLINVHYNQIF